MKFAKSLMTFAVALTLFGCAQGCAARAVEIVPIQETVLNVRKDGCTGPDQYKDYLILGIDQIQSALTNYFWCVSEELIPELKPTVAAIPMPEGFSCPGVKTEDLMAYGFLMSMEDATRLGKAFLACEEAYKIRVETGDQARMPKTEVRR